MGKRDFGRREVKKPKKETRKTITPETFFAPPAVEVIKKKRRAGEE